MKNDFNKIAWAYDSLAGVFFAKSLKFAQKEFLSIIPIGANLLIVGGGTGWLLQALDELNKPLNVVYIEQSKEMIDKAKQRGPFENLRVSFIPESYENASGEYDIIITNFFLDVFNKTNLPNVIQNLRSRLRDGGYWLVTDFEKGNRYWQKALISFMYLFFRLTANLEGKRLLNFDYWLKKNQLYEVSSRRFYHGMIKSTVYKAL